MEISIQNQLIIIVYSFILGLIFGAEYDIIRIASLLLGQIRLKKGIVFLLDFAYMLSVTAACSVFAYCFNNGMMRLFFMIPMGLGFLAYYNTVGRVVMFFSETLVKWIRTVFHYIIYVPVCFVLSRLKKATVWTIRMTYGAMVRFIHYLRNRAYTAKQKKEIRGMIRI